MQTNKHKSVKMRESAGGMLLHRMLVIHSEDLLFLRPTKGARLKPRKPSESNMS